MPDLANHHYSKIKELFAGSFPQFAIIMDGSPLFAEAEGLMIRVVHKKTFKIHTVVVHLELYQESLDGNSIAKHVKDAIAKDIGLQLKHMRATSIDRAGTNKRAMTVLHDLDGIKAFAAFCMPHGLSGCGKKRSLTASEDVIKFLTGMVKFKLCKARTLFTILFHQAPKKRGGVRWGTEHEMCSQIDDIGIIRLRDEYGIKCSRSGWSEQSSKKFPEAIRDPHDLAVAMIETAALSDVGKGLISETYTLESDQPMVFTFSDACNKLNELYAHGVKGFDNAGGFVRLYERAAEAANIMDEVVVRVKES